MTVHLYVLSHLHSILTIFQSVSYMRSHKVKLYWAFIEFIFNVLISLMLLFWSVICVYVILYLYNMDFWYIHVCNFDIADVLMFLPRDPEHFQGGLILIDDQMYVLFLCCVLSGM